MEKCNIPLSEIRTIRILNKWDNLSFMSFVFCVGEVKRSYFVTWKRTEVSVTWKFRVKHTKSCKVNSCYCSFTGVFKGLLASLLFNEPSSHAGKIFLTGGWSHAKKWNKQIFQMLVMRSTISFPNDIGAKSRKYVGPGCSLLHLP